MQSFYRWHWDPKHADEWVGQLGGAMEIFARTPHDIVKVVTVDETIPYLDRLPAGCGILVRYQPMTENFGGDAARVFADEADAKAQARRDSDCMLRVAEWAEARGIPRDQLWFSGRNEWRFPEGGGKETYALGVVYWLELLRLNHERGLNTVAGEFGVGWPPDFGAKDTPPNFEPFRPVYEALGPNDAWSYHAYWGGFGVDWEFKWYNGRMLQRPAWMHGKKLWLTECGTDRVPGWGPTAGWLSYPEPSIAEKAERYMRELARFEELYRAQDPDVEYAFIFTFDGNREDWGRFELMKEEMLVRLIPYLQADHAFTLAPQPTPQVPPVVVPPIVSPPPGSHNDTLAAQFAAFEKQIHDGLADLLAGCAQQSAAAPSFLALQRPIPFSVTPGYSQGFGANPAWYQPVYTGHPGIDYPAPEGTPVRAAHGGRCMLGNDPAGYGINVTIDSDDQTTLYGHLSATLVTENEMVATGDIIGLVGHTGRCKPEGANHLHFGWKVKGIANPAYDNYLDPALGRKLAG